MARKNRVSVRDGVYHVTARIAHQALLMRDDRVKDMVMSTVIDVADFSGVDLWGFCIMENHLHILLHVPPVPEKYWLDPETEPKAHAFGMRPAECRAPLWAEGDCPRQPRPEVGFTLPDDEMISRLAFLYGDKVADDKAKEWEELRRNGLNESVDAEKSGYCRRMYNLSQYVKTVKERVSGWYNREYSHSGCLWQGRFHSTLVERTTRACAIVAAYIGYNPVKAGIARRAEDWRWSSYSLAVRGQSRWCRACERMLGLGWKEARERFEAIYADRLPDGIGEDEINALFADRWEGKGDAERPTYRLSQAIHVRAKLFRGAFFGHDKSFYLKTKEMLPEHFPMSNMDSIHRCMAFDWTLPGKVA